MRLSAMDIRQQQFAIKMIRGLDPQEVDAFLDEVADDWEELLKENNLLKSQLVAAEDQNKLIQDQKRALEEQNKTLQETLITAQRMAEEFRDSSKRAADILLREAQLQAEKFLEEKRQELTKLTGDVEGIKGVRRQAADQLLATLKMMERLVEQRLVDPH
jgi:cell division initiation protein